METFDVIALACDHIENAANQQMFSSAMLCLDDAIRLAHGPGHVDLDAAKVRALKSLAYSVGILHPDYQRAAGKVG